MKPTCPNACPLKQKLNEKKRSNEIMEEIEWNMEQITDFQKRQMLAVANFLLFRHKGAARISTWLDMINRQRVLYTMWGFFVYADNIIWKANHE